MGDLQQEIIIAGRVGHADFINGRYHLQEEKANNKPVYLSEHDMPEEYNEVAGSHLYLYFHDDNDAWVLSHELGSLDVVAFTPSNIKNTWHISNGEGTFIPDPSVKLIGATTREVMTALGPWNAEPHGEVALKLTSDGLGAEEPLTVLQMLQSTAQKMPEAPAFIQYSHDGTSITRTYRQVMEEVITVSKAFVKLGLKPCQSVLILGTSTAEWAIAHLAASSVGGMAAGVYENCSVDDLHYYADHTGADIILVDSGTQLEKVSEILDRLPDLKAIVQYNGHPDSSLMPDPNMLYSWSDLLSVGRDVRDNSDIGQDLEDRMSNLRANKCACLVFTQGTSTDPKTVMLTHDNLTWTAKSLANALECKAGQDSLTCFLPLANATCLMLYVYLPIACGAAVNYFPNVDLLDTTDMSRPFLESKPSLCMLPPKLWNQLSVKAQSAKKLTLKHSRKGTRASIRMQQGEDVKGSALSMFNKIKKTIGMDNCRVAMSFDSNLEPRVAQYFVSITMPIFELYGSAECSGIFSLNRPGNLKPASAGKPLPGTESRMTHGVHELLIQGRNVMMGYLFEPQMTAEAIDERGWYHSRDIIQFDRSKFMYLTGRVDDLVMTAAGTAVPPFPIETALMNKLEGLLSHVILVGQKRKSVSVLLVLKTALDSRGRPTEKLSESALEHVTAAGAGAITIGQCIEGAHADRLRNYIGKAVDEVNAKVATDIQQIKNFEILPRPFSQETGELGPLYKLKRRFVLHRYKSVIDQIYGHEEVDDYENAEWYHGPISRADTQALLKRDGGGWDGWYLVRLSTKEKNTFVITLCQRGKLFHNQIKYSDGVYNTHKDQGNHQYNSLQELINHHKAGKNGFQAKLGDHCKRAK